MGGGGGLFEDTVKNIILFTVMPRIELPELYLFGEVKSGDSIQGGFNRGGGLINFAPKGRNFLHFLSKSKTFYAV